MDKLSEQTKIKNILDFYLLNNRLKDTIRSGWKRWNVSKKRLESVAEHIFGTCALACAIWSETKSNLNLGEIVLTLALHETEEILIGDITPFDSNEKLEIKKNGEKAVYEIFKPLIENKYFFTLIENFDTLSTPEAIFARKCDKLECDLQAKIYDEQGYMDYHNAGEIVNSERIQNYLSQGITSVSQYFILYDKQHFTDDDIFLKISDYIQNNKLLKS